MSSQDWDQRYSASELVWTAEPNGFLVPEVAGLPPGRALDLGCGEGRNAIWLAEQGWQVTGVDFSQLALDKARRISVERGVVVSWIHADLTEYQPAPGAFDLVVMLYLHLPAAKRRQVLARACQALAPRGTLLVVGHDLLNLSQGHGGPQNPEVLYTPADIERELPGLMIERAERVLRAVNVDGRDVNAVDVLVRAKRLGNARGGAAG
jgi:SAM-dependent methyltransferase